MQFEPTYTFRFGEGSLYLESQHRFKKISLLPKVLHTSSIISSIPGFIKSFQAIIFNFLERSHDKSMDTSRLTEKKDGRE